MCVCEADKGRKAAQALIRCHAVGQIIAPHNTSGSGSAINGWYIVSSVAGVGVFTAVQLWTKLAFTSLCILIKAAPENSVFQLLMFVLFGGGGYLPGHTLTEEGGCVSWLNLRRDREVKKSPKKQNRHLRRGTLSERFSPHGRPALSGRTSILLPRRQARWGHKSKLG